MRHAAHRECQSVSHSKLSARSRPGCSVILSAQAVFAVGGSFMRGVITFGLTLLMPLLGFVAFPVQADEAYVCEGGRVIYVKFGELDVLKRTDPCIAAYYRLDLKEPKSPMAEPENDGARPTEARSPASAESAVVKTAGNGQRQVDRAPVSAPALAKPAQQAASQPSGTVGRIVDRAPPTPPVAHPETDFRNVRVLNAQPGDSALYRHLR